MLPAVLPLPSRQAPSRPSLSQCPTLTTMWRMLSPQQLQISPSSIPEASSRTQKPFSTPFTPMRKRSPQPCRPHLLLDQPPHHHRPSLCLHRHHPSLRLHHLPLTAALHHPHTAALHHPRPLKQPLWGTTPLMPQTASFHSNLAPPSAVMGITRSLVAATVTHVPSMMTALVRHATAVSTLAAA